MKSVLALPLAIAALALTPAQALADEARETALATQIVELGYPEDQRVAMFGGAIDAMSSQMLAAMPENMPPAVLAIVKDEQASFNASAKQVLESHIPDLMSALAVAYRDEFSEAELEELLVFMKSPVGRGFFVRSTKLIENPRFAAANQAYMQEIVGMMPDMQARLKSRIEAAMADEGKE